MGTKALYAFLAILHVAGLTWGQDPTVIVDVPVLGKIQGRDGVTSRDQDHYWTFHGIPYADPDSYLGANRFKPSAIYDKPLPHKEGSDVFVANNICVYCPQEAILPLDGDDKACGLIPTTELSPVTDLPSIFRTIHQNKRKRSALFRSFSSSAERTAKFQAEPVDTMGQEDCLTININTPNIPQHSGDDSLLPVVVFYHGGGSDSVWGSAFTGLRMLEGSKVVLVTMNYRLGVLGALNLQVNDAPGNAGLYDSITALEWVKKNIQHFGGDPNLVTISGQSAGSMIVTNLLISPLTKDKNLFHRVWGFSGSAISVWAVSAEPSIDRHLQIAELSGCPVDTGNTAAIVECMQGASLETLVTALALWKHEEEYAGRLGYDARMPSIQGEGITIDKFMPRHPYETLENLEQRNVPVVLGATRHDGSYPLDDIYNNFIKPHGLDKDEEFLKNDLLPFLLRTLGINDDTGELYHAMAKTYLGNASLTGTWEDKLPGMLDMVTTLAFKSGSYEVLKFQSKLTPHAYFYSLDYVGRWSLYNFLWGDMYIPGGICHTDDLIYFFWLGPLINEDMKVSRRWVDYFINFAYYGDPNGDPENPETKIFWEPYDAIKHPYMKLDRHDKIVYDAPDYWVGAAEELFVDWSPPSEGSTTMPPTDSPTDSSGNPITDSPTDAPTDSSGNPITDSPTDSPTDSSGNPITDSPTDAPTDSSGNPTTDSPTTPESTNPPNIAMNLLSSIPIVLASLIAIKSLNY